jgi:hypothetical protein
MRQSAIQLYFCSSKQSRRDDPERLFRRLCESLLTLSFASRCIGSTLGKSAFCSSLWSICLPSSLETISLQSSLETISLPSSLETIFPSCFSHCENLRRPVMKQRVSILRTTKSTMSEAEKPEHHGDEGTKRRKKSKDQGTPLGERRFCACSPMNGLATATSHNQRDLI